MKNAFFGALSIVLGVVIAFALLEVCVRLFESDGTSYDIEMWRYARELKKVSDIPGVGHEHSPGKTGIYMGIPVAINREGWRDIERTLAKKPGVVRIMMLGDSLTFGWGVAPDEVVSRRLEQRLNSRGDGEYEVLNTGIGNANTAMETAYFIHKGALYKPDIVVLNYFINDAEVTPKRKNNFFVENFYATVFLGGRYDILARRFFGRSDWQHYYRDLYAPDQPGWLAAKRAIAELSAYCTTHHIKLVIIHYPELHQLAPYPFQDITDQVAAQARRLNIPFLDLLPFVRNEDPKSLWVTATDAHPNGRASAIYAREMDRFLSGIVVGENPPE